MIAPIMPVMATITPSSSTTCPSLSQLYGRYGIIDLPDHPGALATDAFCCAMYNVEAYPECGLRGETPQIDQAFTLSAQQYPAMAGFVLCRLISLDLAKETVTQKAKTISAHQNIVRILSASPDITKDISIQTYLGLLSTHCKEINKISLPNNKLLRPVAIQAKRQAYHILRRISRLLPPVSQPTVA